MKLTCLSLWPLVKKVWKVTSLLPAPPQKKSTCAWQLVRTDFLYPWFAWVKTVSKGRGPGTSGHYYEHKPGYFERKLEENKTSCSIPCLLLRFSKTHEFQSSKANWLLRFLLLSIILEDLLGSRNLLQRVQKVMVFYWWISICFVCTSVSRLIACDCNDWWQKMQLWRLLLIFRVLVFLKSTANIACTGNLKFL